MDGPLHRASLRVPFCRVAKIGHLLLVLDMRRRKLCRDFIGLEEILQLLPQPYHPAFQIGLLKGRLELPQSTPSWSLPAIIQLGRLDNSTLELVPICQRRIRFIEPLFKFLQSGGYDGGEVLFRESSSYDICRYPL